MPSNWLINEQPETAYKIAARQTPELAKVIDSVTGFFGPQGTLNIALSGAQKTVGGVSNFINGVPTTTNTVSGAPLLNNLSPDTYARLRYQYSNIYVATLAGKSVNALSAVQDTMVASVSGASMKLQETLKPFSSFMGSTLGTLTGVMKDPIGSVSALPNTLSHMLGQTNPTLAAKYEATFKKYHINKLAELPQAVFGSIKHITQVIDQVLAVPIQFVTDIYYGAMEILKKIGEMVDGVFSLIEEILVGFIRGVFPGLMEFLSTLQTFADQVSGILSTFSGLTQYSNYASQISITAGKLNGIIQNPLEFAMTYLPADVSKNLSEIRYTLRNPQQLINSLIPPKVADMFANITKITGFGFNGNMGYGLENVLRGFQGGVISSIMEGYATQFPILAPLYTGPSIPPPIDFPNSTMIARGADGSQYNLDRTTGQVVRLKRPEPVIKPKKT